MKYCPTMTSRGFTATVLACVGAVLAQAPDARQDVHGYLSRHGFDATELSKLEAGTVVAHADLDQRNDREVLVVAAGKIRGPRPQVLSDYGQTASHGGS